MEKEQTLATELLHELKAQSKRWFIAFVVTLILWFVTIGIFIWYVSLPIEDYEITQNADETYRSIQIVGGSNYGDTDSEVQEESPQNP